MNYTFILYTLFIVLLIIFLIYIGLVIFSFLTMHQFKKEIKNRLESINILIFQKCDSLRKLANILLPYMDDKNPLYRFYINKEYEKFNKLKDEEVSNFFNFSEKILSYAQKVYIDNDLKEDKKKVEELFSVISEINNKYFSSVQLYNTSVVAYNYWRNLYSTRWIKRLLFIKEINSIK